MALLFCHECGVELPISNQDGVCSGCSTSHGEAQYTVRAINGGHYGPMPHHRVIEQLERGFHSGEDLVSCGGGESSPIEQHVDFAAYFIEGDSRSRQLTDTVRRRKRKQNRRHRKQRLTSLVKGIVGVGFVGAAIWFFPEIVIWGQDLISPSSSEESMSEESAGLVVQEAVVTRLDSLLVGLEERRSTREGEETLEAESVGSIEAVYEEAWAYLLTGDPQKIELSVDIMESILVRSGGEAWALSALIFAKCANMVPEVSSLDEIEELISILDEIGASDDGALSETWESELARAALARQGGVWHEVAVHADRCLTLRPSEPACAWLAGEAWAEAGDYESAIEVLDPVLALWPDSFELMLIQARALLGTGDQSAASEIIGQLRGGFEGAAGNVGLLRVTADFELAVGNFQGAIENYEAMVAQGAATPAVLFTLGKLRLQVQNDYDGAFELLQPLVENGVSENFDWLLQASHSARMVGQHELALNYATIVADGRREWGPGVLARAMALDAMGRTEEATAAFRQVRTGSLSGREAARFYLWVANFHNRQEFGRLATNAHSEVERYNEDSVGLVVSKLQLALFVGGKTSIVDILGGLHLLDLEAEAVASPLVDNWYPDSDSSRLAMDIAELFAQDPSLTPVFDRTVGLAGIFDCLNGVNCSRVVHHLNLALERDETDVAALAGLGRVYFSQGRYDESARYLQRALREAGDSPVLQSMYGDSLWRVGRQPESEVAFQQAMHTSANSSVAVRRYAVALAEWGRLDEAAEIGARALLLDENDTETLRRLVAAGVPVE